MSKSLPFTGPSDYMLHASCVQRFNHISNSLGFQQLREQIGFRAGYSTVDYIYVINHVIEKCVECKDLTYLQTTKVFHSLIGHWRRTGSFERSWNGGWLLEALERQRRMHGQDSLVPLARKEARQGEAMSPKLFAACAKRIQEAWQEGRVTE